MKSLALAILLLTEMCVCTDALADTFGTPPKQFEIEFVTIGDPGNPADATGAPNPAGAVDYVYNIGKHEISRDMIEKANAEGGLGLSLPSMDFVTGGPRPDMPAGVSWSEAARFTNWLNISQGFPAAYKFSTQPGDTDYNAQTIIDLWVPADDGFDPDNPFRNSQAKYFLPSADEWYKAAYYESNANGGAGGYWDFPTGSDSEPTAVVSGTDPGTAVYLQTVEQGPADITQAGGLSPYGVMGLGGNVWEWEETEPDLMNDLVGRSDIALRGGDFTDDPTYLSASTRLTTFGVVGLTTFQHGDTLFGFRVASIPEPTSRPLDLNLDSNIDVMDIDALIERVVAGTHPSGFDLNDDGLVDTNDRDHWLSAAASEKGFVFPFLLGDANLDGSVNAADLNQLGQNWLTSPNTWQLGNFTADGRIDANDLNELGQNWQMSIPLAASLESVPEPTGMPLLFVSAFLAALMRCQKNHVC